MSSSPPLVVADRYRLVAPLGQGGMGRVWRATDVVLHRDVAIKELVPPPGLTPDERREMRERSLREARAIARLNNINVVRVFDVLRTDADPWIVMEYVPSRSLQDILASDGPFQPVRAAEIGLGVLNALRAAHRAGVVHRDVKPGNVLIGGDGRVVLTDFGLATVPGDPNVTRTGLVLGSPAYISPERARDGTAGPSADLWSLGATLYAAVEGASPFARPSAIATLAALATENPPPARNAGPLKPVLNGLLRKDPTHRINAEEAERLLLRAAGRRSKLTFPMSPTMRRPGVGRERPKLPPLAPGAPPVVPGPRPPVSRPPVTPARPGQPAADGHPVFAPGKASVGRRPADTPTRVDGPKIDATRVDTPPVKDKPVGGTSTAQPGSAQTPQKPASGPTPGATMRGSRIFGGITADEVAAHRGRAAAARASTPEAPAAPPTGTPERAASPVTGTPAGATPTPDHVGPSSQTERPGDRGVMVPATRPGATGSKDTGRDEPAAEPGDVETAVPASGQPASAASGLSAPAVIPDGTSTRSADAESSAASSSAASPAAEASVADSQAAGASVADSQAAEASSASAPAAQASSAAGAPAVEAPESAVSARPSQQRDQGTLEPPAQGERPATAVSQGRSDASSAAIEADSTSVPSGSTAAASPATSEDRTAEAAPAGDGAEAAETTAPDRAVPSVAQAEAGLDEAVPSGVQAEAGADEAVPSGVQAEAGADEAVPSGVQGEAGADEAVPSGVQGEAGADEAVPSGVQAEARADEAASSGIQGEAGPADAAESSAASGQTAAIAQEKSPASGATRTGTGTTSASRSKSPATAPEAGATAPERVGAGDSGSAAVADDSVAVASAADGDPQSDDTTTVRRNKPAVGARAGTSGSKASRKKGRGRTAVATGAASKTGPVAPTTGDATPGATGSTLPEAGSAPVSEAASTTGTEAASGPATEAASARGTEAAKPGNAAASATRSGNAAASTATTRSENAAGAAATARPATKPKTAQAEPAKSGGAPGNDTTKNSAPGRTASKATPARPAARKTATARATAATAAAAKSQAAQTRPDPTKVVPAGGALPSGFVAGSTRPAWQPMTVKPSGRGAKGLTVFGTTLTRQQTVIGVAILVAVVLALVLIVPMAFGGSDDENKGKKAGGVSAPSATGRQTTSAPAAPATTTPTSAAPTSAAPPSSPPAGNGAVQLPSGWHIYADSSGFKVPVPASWRVSHEGTETYFREQGGQHRLMIVDQTTQPAPDPVADWTGLESRRKGKYPDYHRVSIKAVDYWDKAADWEYTYTSNSGNPLHVVKRGFITAKNQAYGITWSTSEKDWAGNLDNLELIYQGFVPARS